MFKYSPISSYFVYGLLLVEIVAGTAHPGYKYLPPKGGAVLSDEPPVHKKPQTVQHDSQFGIQVDEPLDIRQPEVLPVRDPFPAYNNFGTQANFIPGTLSGFPQSNGFGGPAVGFPQIPFGGLQQQQQHQQQPQQFLPPPNFGGFNFPSSAPIGFNPFVPMGGAGFHPPTGAFYPSIGGAPNGPGGPFFPPSGPGPIGSGNGFGFPNIFRYPQLPRVLADPVDIKADSHKTTSDTAVTTKIGTTDTKYGSNGGYLYKKPKLAFS